jgi:beta-1,4-N-acetylglucosaminyltransferase
MTAVFDSGTAKNWRYDESRPMKVCFVTTGATAPFTGLIEAILRPESIEALINEGYTHLLVQYGTAKIVFTEKVDTAISLFRSTHRTINITIGGMDFNSEGLQEQFRLAQLSKGMAISHAGR